MRCRSSSRRLRQVHRPAQDEVLLAHAHPHSTRQPATVMPCWDPSRTCASTVSAPLPKSGSRPPARAGDGSPSTVTVAMAIANMDAARDTPADAPPGCDQQACPGNRAPVGRPRPAAGGHAAVRWLPQAPAQQVPRRWFGRFARKWPSPCTIRAAAANPDSVPTSLRRWAGTAP